jgi:hypothetical protein
MTVLKATAPYLSKVMSQKFNFLNKLFINKLLLLTRERLFFALNLAMNRSMAVYAGKKKPD